MALYNAAEKPNQRPNLPRRVRNTLFILRTYTFEAGEGKRKAARLSNAVFLRWLGMTHPDTIFPEPFDSHFM